MFLTRDQLAEKAKLNTAIETLDDGTKIRVQIMSAKWALDLKDRLDDINKASEGGVTSGLARRQYQLFADALAGTVLDAQGGTFYSGPDDDLFDLMDFDQIKDQFSAVMRANGMGSAKDDEAEEDTEDSEGK